MHAFAASEAPFGVRPLTPKLGAEISGLELARGIAPDDFRALYDAFLRYEVLVFPPNELPPAAQVAFARQFGEVQVHVMTMYHADGFPRTRRHGTDLMTEAQKKEAPPVEHPIVRRHPETGRACLYLCDLAESIVGMPYDEGRALIDELNALAVHADLTYEHHWRAN